MSARSELASPAAASGRQQCEMEYLVITGIGLGVALALGGRMSVNYALTVPYGHVQQEGA